MGIKVNVSITSGTGIGGVYPFVVVCFDGDLSNELYKTPATTAGPTAVWNSTFQLDLTTQIKAHIAAGHPEPKYLTFFIFDTGAPGVPSLGSAGVLLATVHEAGIAQGDFQVVNGTGTLSLIVSNEKYMPEGEHQAWYKTNTAKIAAGTGAAAIAAGLGGLALHKHKKKKKPKLTASTAHTASETGLVQGTRGVGDSDEEENENENEQQQQAESNRPWYDPGTSSESSSEKEERSEKEEQPEYQVYETDDRDEDDDGEEEEEQEEPHEEPQEEEE